MIGAEPSGAELRHAEITAVVVNWNTRELLARCLESLRANAPSNGTLEIVVVDNGSGDGSAESVRTGWPQVRLIANSHNEGFTRANNRAIRTTTSPYLLLVNADAFVRPGCIDQLLARLDADPQAGVAAPRLVYTDGSWQRWTAGRAPSLASAAAYFLFLERFLPAARRRSMYLAEDRREAFRPEWVSSACMLVRRAALDDVGLLNEQFFAYMDDVDLCQRLRERGWTVWYCPEVDAVHVMGGSTRRRTGRPSPAAVRSFNRYFRQRHNLAATVLVRAIEAVGFGARALILSAAGMRSPELRERARAHWAYLRLALESDRGD